MQRGHVKTQNNRWAAKALPRTPLQENLQRSPDPLVGGGGGGVASPKNSTPADTVTAKPIQFSFRRCWDRKVLTNRSKTCQRSNLNLSLLMNITITRQRLLEIAPSTSNIFQLWPWTWPSLTWTVNVSQRAKYLGQGHLVQKLTCEHTDTPTHVKPTVCFTCITLVVHKAKCKNEIHF